MSGKTELLPCPLCGGEAEVIEADYGMYMTGYAVYCRKCCLKLGGEGRLGEAYEWSPVFNTEAEAIAAWNARAPVEHDGWFYLPKPKESIVQYGEQRTEKTEHGYKVTQPVEVIEGAIRSWGDELGEYIMKRICEAWNTRTHSTLTAEQVREVIERHVKFYEGGDYDEQAIAGELNATLGCGECENANDVMKSGEIGFLCSECGSWDDAPQPRFCHNCGRKVKR